MSYLDNLASLDAYRKRKKAEENGVAPQGTEDLALEGQNIYDIPAAAEEEQEEQLLALNHQDPSARNNVATSQPENALFQEPQIEPSQREEGVVDQQQLYQEQEAERARKDEEARAANEEMLRRQEALGAQQQANTPEGQEAQAVADQKTAQDRSFITAEVEMAKQSSLNTQKKPSPVEIALRGLEETRAAQIKKYNSKVRDSQRYKDLSTEHKLQAQRKLEQIANQRAALMEEWDNTSSERHTDALTQHYAANPNAGAEAWTQSRAAANSQVPTGEIGAQLKALDAAEKLINAKEQKFEDKIDSEEIKRLDKRSEDPFDSQGRLRTEQNSAAGDGISHAQNGPRTRQESYNAAGGDVSKMPAKFFMEFRELGMKATAEGDRVLYAKDRNKATHVLDVFKDVKEKYKAWRNLVGDAFLDPQDERYGEYVRWIKRHIALLGGEKAFKQYNARQLFQAALNAELIAYAKAAKGGILTHNMLKLFENKKIMPSIDDNPELFVNKINDLIKKYDLVERKASYTLATDYRFNTLKEVQLYEAIEADLVRRGKENRKKEVARLFGNVPQEDEDLPQRGRGGYDDNDLQAGGGGYDDSDPEKGGDISKNEIAQVLSDIKNGKKPPQGYLELISKGLANGVIKVTDIFQNAATLSEVAEPYLKKYSAKGLIDQVFDDNSALGLINKALGTTSSSPSTYFQDLPPNIASNAIKDGIKTTTGLDLEPRPTTAGQEITNEAAKWSGEYAALALLSGLGVVNKGIQGLTALGKLSPLGRLAAQKAIKKKVAESVASVTSGAAKEAIKKGGKKAIEFLKNPKELAKAAASLSKDAITSPTAIRTGKGAIAGAAAGTTASLAKDLGVNPFVADIGSALVTPNIGRFAKSIKSGGGKERFNKILGLDPESINKKAAMAAQAEGIYPSAVNFTNKPLAENAYALAANIPGASQLLKKYDQGIGRQLIGRLSEIAATLGPKNTKEFVKNIGKDFEKTQKAAIKAGIKTKPKHTIEATTAFLKDYKTAPTNQSTPAVTLALKIQKHYSNQLKAVGTEQEALLKWLIETEQHIPTELKIKPLKNLEIARGEVWHEITKSGTPPKTKKYLMDIWKGLGEDIKVSFKNKPTLYKQYLKNNKNFSDMSNRIEAEELIHHLTTDPEFGVADIGKIQAFTKDPEKMKIFTKHLSEKNAKSAENVGIISDAMVSSKKSRPAKTDITSAAIGGGAVGAGALLTFFKPGAAALGLAAAVGATTLFNSKKFITHVIALSKNPNDKLAALAANRLVREHTKYNNIMGLTKALQNEAERQNKGKNERK